MIDITMVDSGTNTYSIKYIIDIENNTKKSKIKILRVDLVEPISKTSCKKLKTIYERESTNEIFNKNRYNAIYKKLIDVISQKYKVTGINFI